MIYLIPINVFAVLESRDVLYALPDIRIRKTTNGQFFPSYIGRSQLKEILSGRLSRLKEIARFPSPSEGVKSDEKIKAWVNDKSIVHPHQPAGNYGPHTALFHPALARLQHRLTYPDQVEEPSAEHFKWAHDFLWACGDVYEKEDLREAALREIVNVLIGEGAVWQGRFSTRTAQPDATWGEPIHMILELKNCDGVGGNATLQALLDYAKYLEILDVCPLHPL